MRTVALRHLATIMNSNVDKLSDANELPVRLCNYVDVYKNDRIVADLDFMSATASPAEIEKFRLQVGDVIITKDSEDRHDIAVPAIVSQSAPDLICGYHLTILRARNEIALGEFLFWALQSKIAREYFANAAGGVTRFGLTLDGIKSAPVPLPDRETQRAIADFLDRETARIDQLVEKKVQLLELLDHRFRNFAAHLTTRGIDSADLVSTRIDWNPLAPANWEVRRMADLFSESMELGGEDLPVLSVSINTGISDRELGDEDRHRMVNHIEDRNAYKRVRVGDLVYNMMRAWQGGFGVAKVDGLVSPAYVVARPKVELYATYFEYVTRTPNCIEQFRRASKGIADFRQRLYWEHFRQVRIAIPPFEEQRQIANALDGEAARSDPIKTLTQKSIDRLREYRAALITAAVTGQIDVSEHTRMGDTDRRLDAIEAEMRA